MKDTFLKKAAENMPEIKEKNIALQAPVKKLGKGDSIVIDMGNHYVGYFSFKLNWLERYLDAPVRLYIKFCETERELDDDFSQYNGWICSSWLQQEYINLDYPIEYKLLRRYAARYIRIEVVDTPQIFALSDFIFTAVTSADESELKKAEILDNELKRIDEVSVNTLKNCMHRVFEDGPKRDRRVWIGDLRLQALANYPTFNTLPIVRRCLYLFAAADTTEAGFIPANLYEYPEFVSGKGALADYSLLYAALVCDYYQNTGDKAVFDDLYPVVKKQMDVVDSLLDESGIADVFEKSGVFIDWCKGLNKKTAFHGVYMYVLNLLAKTMSMMEHEDTGIYAERYDRAKASALNVLYDSEKRAFVNAADEYQYSVHSAVWMILGGAAEGAEAKRILLDALSSADSVKPFTPYMHHYVVEAMIKAGMLSDAEKYIKDYWGAMIKLGADTFYEVFVPSDPDFSPYDDRMINSMCHAWSCTPAYFIRKYLI